MNQFCLVGRIASMPVLQTTPQGWMYCKLDLLVNRPFTNARGIVEPDKITIDIYRAAAEEIASNNKINDWLSVKGRISAKESFTEPNKVEYNFVAETVDYLH